MPGLIPRCQAFNQTRQVFLATDSLWPRHTGRVWSVCWEPPQMTSVMGGGLWIRPCRGVHTLAMRFPIDVLYLDRAGTVVHAEHNLQPWRFSPVRMQAASVLELPSHTLARTDTALGDSIEIKLKEIV